MTWGIRVFTGRSMNGLEAVVNYHGTAFRGLYLENTGLCPKRLFIGGRPRAMRFAASMFSPNPKEWPV